MQQPVETYDLSFTQVQTKVQNFPNNTRIKPRDDNQKQNRCKKSKKTEYMYGL